MRLVLKGLGQKTIVSLPACCWSIIAGPWPQSSLKVPLFHTAFETGASAASGIKAALVSRGDNETTVMAWAGDGGTFDIGLQALSGAAERNEDFIYVCYDNEAYMNTGIQRSSATPFGAWTTTTPIPAWPHRKKDIGHLTDPLRGHGPWHFRRPARRSAGRRPAGHAASTSSPAPGWCADPDQTIRLARLAVDTRIFPLYEVWEGADTAHPPPAPAAEYLRRQGRFAHLTPEDMAVQAEVDTTWQRCWPAAPASSRCPTPRERPTGRSRERNG
jgi:pyruvate/2-oxoacid:ferredoxin oxidoreductase beta subunit